MTPDDEVAFISAVNAARDAYNAADSDMQRGASRPHRAKAICAALKSKRIADWVGTVKTVSTNNDGKGVLAVEVDEDVEIGTWNNAFSDIIDNTLVEPDSPVYNAMLSLSKGDAVHFAGQFKDSDTDCVKETSLGLGGSMKEPSFLFRFSSITPAKMSETAE